MGHQITYRKSKAATDGGRSTHKMILAGVVSRKDLVKVQGAGLFVTGDYSNLLEREAS